MGLEQLQVECQRQVVQTGQILIAEALTNAQLTVGSQFQSQLQSYFMISGDVVVVTKQDIPAPQGDKLTFAGTSSLLHLQNVDVELTFTLEQGAAVVVLIVVHVKDGWKFSDSFTFLAGYPFDTLAFRGSSFLFTTKLQDTYSWQGQQLTLQQGLNYTGYVQLSGPFQILETLLAGGVADEEVVFSGYVDPTHLAENIPYPDMLLTGPVLKSVTGIQSFGLGNPRVSLEIVRDQQNYQYVWLSFIVTLTVNNQPYFDIKTAILRHSSIVFSVVPETNKGITLEQIIKLCAGEDFTKSIPDILKSAFEAVSLKGFAISLSLPGLRISSISTAIGASKPWQLGELTVNDLVLRYTILNPFGQNPFSQAKMAFSTFEAAFQFFPAVFPGTFSLEIVAGDSGNQLLINGNYQGKVSLSAILDEISGHTIKLPQEFPTITFSDFGVSFTKQNDSYAYTLYGRSDISFDVPILGGKVKSNLQVSIQSSNNQKSYQLVGGLSIGSSYFSAELTISSGQTVLTGSWKAMNQQYLELNDLLPALDLPSPGIPANLDLGLQSATFTYDFTTKTFILTADSKNYGQAIFIAQQEASGAFFAFGLDISVNIPSLSNLPLVGRELPADQTIKVNDLQLLIASKEIKQDVVTSLDALIPSGVTKLPGTDLSQGLNLSASMNFGGSPQILAVPVARAGATTSPAPVLPAPSTAAGVTSADNAKWFTLEKSFGPVHFNRVGVKYQDAAAWFLLDASLSLAGLTLSLDGLAFGSSLSKFDPKFDLHGLGIDYRTGAAEIGGAFLRTEGKLSDGTTYDEYDGAAVIKTEELTLSALGSYAILQEKDSRGILHDNPSLFIYAVLDYPLGGPSFFFITGLAAGFGYNRSLIVPPVDRVAQFPLVSAAVNGASPPQDVKELTAALTQLAQYIHPELGEIFFAIGIKFTSFKIIDSFVLLTVAFGNELEINVLGLSTMIQPPPVPGEPAITPLAEVQMALKATFIPAQGFLGISAQLTSASYIISRSCQLTGGFAFYTWFAGVHSGDFVQTLGGYHPSFIVPGYYPRVPRLGYNWQVDGQLSIKGGAYFALTASLLMAGMQVQATWNSGNLQAWFNIALDFIIAWKPFHYDATAHLDLGASYTFEFFGTHHLTFDVGADLHIWGPEFSGQAHINLDIISFDVSFGNSSAQLPSPIDWPTFKQSFLPPDTAICGVSVTDGLVSKQSKDASDLGVINPKYFVLVTNSLIPSSQAHIHNDLTISQVYYTESGTQQLLASFSASPADGKLVQAPPPGAKMKATGSPAIRSMRVQSSGFTSKHTIVITRDGNNVELDFAYTPILKNVPVGLWGQPLPLDPNGQPLQPNLNGQRFVDDAVSGFEIRPAVQAAPGETARIERSKLQYDLGSIAGDYSWTQDILTFQADSLDEPSRRERISDSLVAPATAAARQQLFAALEVSAETIDLSQTIASTLASTFLFAPQVEKV